MKRIVSIVLLLFIANTIFSQDTLPNFSLIESGNKVIVSWTNPFDNLVQLNIQRSYDSLRNFRTIYSANSPELPQNGFSENKLPDPKVYYRIFYVLQGGAYFFTKSQLSVPGSDAKINPQLKGTILKNGNKDMEDLRTITIKLKDSILRQIPINNYRSFRDSILKQTKDTLLAVNDSLVFIKRFVPREVWKPSPYVFTNKDGYIKLLLPSKAPDKKYSIKFFEENGYPLFEISHLKDTPLLLDKANFVHSGWFLFELYENGELKEKNKFYLPKDF